MDDSFDTPAMRELRPKGTELAIGDTVQGRDTKRIGKVVRWWIPGRVAVVHWMGDGAEKVGVRNLERLSEGGE